ncbi:MAG: class I SAM-dependent methyltransferase [Dehalococcoidia bacterium]|nr:class I SAM-dependent methyltransferase [Dehalococcoidia bacterium]MDP7083440.1 class I SAM-dependent methyltransferase [Dehalococcoidia bacterium]MDP7199464.1 class I SAM-dependent methyltransferase [Dehalococcoidia bacterium]MDP7509517.1 class I SAM-dependent methyltransferase [Dehalococcoidia bacterium]HJN86754.1 class I SAM-dependent methyltransferase [Dehalococcoidia bacterium]
MTQPETPKERLHWIYASQGNRDLEERYDSWAGKYDEDVAGYGYKIPGIVAGFVGRYLKPADGPLLDAGAGTGVMGEVLALLGYRELVAMDLSTGMLEVARSKGIYRELRQMVMGEQLDFPDNAFAGATAVGVLSVAHAPPESFAELIRCTRPGGPIIFSVRADAQGFKEVQDGLERDKKWSLIETAGPFVSLPLGEPDIKHLVFAYRVV